MTVKQHSIFGLTLITCSITGIRHKQVRFANIAATQNEKKIIEIVID